MAGEVKKEIQLEIAHVLFIDIVGYSKLSINEQHAAVEELNQVVRASEQFQRAEAAGRLLKIATGDGMALVFYASPEAPAHCALEISRALKERSRLQLRMGIHSGPVSGVVDVNNRPNLAGAGLNMAQRVMACGDAGHILVSKHAAEDLGEYEHWRPLLHDLGECEVKHGMRLSIVNLYGGEVGNPQLPKKFQALKKRRARMRWATTTAVLLALAAIVAGIAMFSRYRARSTLAAPEKSIAVLPFENRSEEKANAYFADGIQDEILTRLSKIADLKVISRTSTQHYKSAPENLPEIARQLGVANIVEGSVQKVGDAVRVNVQLIKAANDSHLWADTFDRKLTDIFSVETEVARAIADQLRAKLTGQEEQLIAAKPTDNLEAYDAYLQGRYYEQHYSAADLRKAIGFYEAAIRSDPHYALAYAALSKSWWALGDITGEDVVEANRKARAAAERAVAEDPNLADGHAALGQILISVDWNATGAEAEYRRAAELAPASAEPKIGLSSVLADFGRIEEAVELLQQAVRLEPLTANAHFDLARLLTALGRYDEAVQSARKAIDLQPGGAGTWEMLALVEAKRGDGEAALRAAAQETDADWRAYAIALAQQARGDGVAADAALDALIAGHSDDMSFQIATVYAFRGDADKTFEWLDRAYEKRDPGVMAISDNPFTRELRSDPRFVAFCKKVGLPWPP
jgi:TolB-like protein